MVQLVLRQTGDILHDNIYGLLLTPIGTVSHTH